MSIFKISKYLSKNTYGKIVSQFFINFQDNNDGGDDVDGGEPVDLSEKQRAKASCESRRRLERKLEEARMQKQVQEYDFDDDYD